MKKYSFAEMLKELNLNSKLKFKGYNIYGNGHTHDLFMKEGELKIYKHNEEVYKHGNKLIVPYILKRKIAPYLLYECINSSQVYFTKLLSHDEKLIEKWSQVKKDTPIELRDCTYKITLVYFMEFDSNTLNIKASCYKNSDSGFWRSTASGIKLINDKEFDIFENKQDRKGELK